ncbi:amyloid fiber anchoring/assembly protein TapA [Aquibacillus sp. 3ASR75-11]|uniref:Amyloid fiber anchoring/assembly protein TapA n=1 Tax=Terrihalobacillus insolitus TaxID=2950438 RepID=A0A9X3WV49_9BACI|nr:amyloid fiber anchoring/assembly protein TapA [Terrihalobacillus insolitus]MDC3413622.1 amyloid fiber anchoring/assembly protein TapA [Terrihalobacillus insolitus]MDC3424621.1 amyloid fiber anchoring/assembly protein TapA [Terrihalobacillus insolitus]
MRRSRLSRFKKKKRLKRLLILQMIAVYSLGILFIIQVTSPTNANFNDIERLSFPLTASNGFYPEGGWDKSSLSFIQQGVKCEENSIYAVIQNGDDSRAMKGPVPYELYWIEKSNPKNGEIVAEGSVPALGSGKEFTITYLPEKLGNYMFKAYQRPEHPGQGELWSEQIQFDGKSCIKVQEKTPALQPLETEEPTNTTVESNPESVNQLNKSDNTSKQSTPQIESENTTQDPAKQTEDTDTTQAKQTDQRTPQTNEPTNQVTEQSQSEDSQETNQNSDQTKSSDTNNQAEQQTQSEQGGDSFNESDT